ncbi:MAG: hypothetical protein L0387_10460 [Acidobacteria bacterium]|nr:hypothetical protein [Acidobacteriota bacterium]
MSDSLADRLKRLSEQHTKGQKAEHEVKDFQNRVNGFIAEQSKPEYDRVLALIRKRVEEVNPDIGDLPKFQVRQNGEVIEHGNAAAYVYFDKPILNAPDNALLITFGPHQNAMYFLEAPPAPERYRLQAAASDGLDHIVWVGDLGELVSEQLVDFILEHLTQYYLQCKRG